jgi:hypothetical protein
MNFLKNFNVQVTGAFILAILSYFGYQQYSAAPPSDPTVAVTPTTSEVAPAATEEAAPAAAEEPATATDAEPTTTDEEETPEATTEEAK